MAKKTIYDMSRELNLAPSTISKALNNVKGVNEETRNQVIAYAKENGYFANPTARALKSKRNYTIGILYSEESHVGLEHPFFSPVLQAAKECFENNGYDLIFINSKAKDYHSYSEFCSLRNIAGIFVVSASYDDVLLHELVESDEFKVVATDYINDKVLTVLSDNAQGVKELVKHFKSKGAKSAGIMIAKNSVRSFQERLVAFKKECDENGINFNDDRKIVVEDYTFEKAYEATVNYLKQNKLPDFIFALSDIYAIAAIRALTDNGYSVPNDCSIVGFDDIELDTYFTPTVSTIRQHAKQIGQLAADYLIKQLNDEYVENKIYRVPVTLMIRNSSK